MGVWHGSRASETTEQASGRRAREASVSRGGSPVSYRSFKHLLGETSLERKCRFIFGGGILVLVTFSFYWYGQKTESLVIGQTTQRRGCWSTRR